MFPFILSLAKKEEEFLKVFGRITAYVFFRLMVLVNLLTKLGH